MINVMKNDRVMLSVIHDFLTDEECEEILRWSWQDLEKATVSSKDGKGQLTEGRTGSHTWVYHNVSPEIERIGQKIADTVRIPLSHAEPFQVVYYGEGEMYDYHYDTFDEEDEAFNSIYLDNGGQRLVTALGYLRDVPKGGGTGFNLLGIEVQPRKGTMIFWHNVLPDTNKRDPFSKHAGLPVLEGEKYAFNLWFREREFK
tara:strand:+ start:1197 stop:1799 length:603 start_codon:yes stop_codon:yes gene_type:complete